MTYQKRKPSTKLTLTNALFNQLVGILDSISKMDVIEENSSLLASNLKNKLLTYSVARITDDGTEFVDVRFFPNEASNIIWLLLMQVETPKDIEDYYKIVKDKKNN